MTQTLRIDRWHPARLNELLGCWQAASRRKASDRKVVSISAFDVISKAEGKRRVELTITLGPRQRAGDPDCYFKSLLDAMTACGLLVDDSRQWVELAPVQFDRGPVKATTIVLTDLP